MTAQEQGAGPQTPEEMLTVAQRVIKRSVVGNDAHTLGYAMGQFVTGAVDGGLERDEAIDMAGNMLTDFVDASLHAESAHEGPDEDDDYDQSGGSRV